MPKALEWTPKLVDRFWNGIAVTPLDELSFARVVGAQLLEHVRNHLRPGDACLDFGAGDGSLVRLLLERGCRVAAYEPSPDRLANIKGQDFARDPNFLGVIGPGSDQKFDVVIVAEVIEHVLADQLPHALEQLRRFLRPNGTIIVSTPNSENLGQGLAYCPVCDHTFHRWQHVRSFTADSLDSLLSKAGFQRLEDHRVDFSQFAMVQHRLALLEKRLRYFRWLGPFFLPFVKSIRIKHEGGLRTGAETTLIYVGRKIEVV